MRAQAPGEDVRSENGGDRGDEKREMEGGLVLAGDHRHESDEVRGERGVLHDLPHGLLGAVPVHGEPVKVERMRPDLPRRLQKERIVDVERLAGEGKQRDHRQRRQQSARGTLS